MVTVTQVMDVPGFIRALSSLEPISYVDLFVAESLDAPGATPEQLARAAIEEASPLGRALAWRIVCNLRLARDPSPEHIGGWKIVGRGDTWVRVQAASWFMTAQMVFAVEDTRASFATFIRYDRPVAALIWGAASMAHRAVAPGFLGGGVADLNRTHRSVDMRRGRKDVS